MTESDLPLRSRGFKNPWAIFALCAFSFFMVFLNRMSIGVMVSDLKAEFSASALQLGFLSSIAFYIYGALQIPAGLIADRIGPRKTIAGGLLIAVAGSVMFALSPSLPLCILARTINSIGIAAVYIPSLRLFLDIFTPELYPTAAALFIATGQTGGMTASLPMALIVGGIGWRGSYWVLAAATLGIALLIIFFLPRGREHHREAPAAAMAEAAPVKRTNWLGLAFLAGIGFMCFGPMQTYQGLWGIPLYMDVYGLPRVAASSIIMLMPLGNVVGNLILAVILARVRIKKGPAVVLGVFVSVLCWVPLAFATSSMALGVAYGVSLLLGLATSLTGVTINSISPLWLGDKNRATALALINTGNIAGAAVFQLGMGGIIDATAARSVGAQYQAAYLFAFAGVAVAFVFALVEARLLRSGSGRLGRVAKAIPLE